MMRGNAFPRLSSGATPLSQPLILGPNQGLVTINL